MEKNPCIAISELAKTQKISAGHLSREFSRIVGLSPRTLSNIIRMRAFLNDLDIMGEVDWADLAIQHRWFDQAHFIRNFKRHVGCTPTQYLVAQKLYAENSNRNNAAGFVPEY